VHCQTRPATTTTACQQVCLSEFSNHDLHTIIYMSHSYMYMTRIQYTSSNANKRVCVRRSTCIAQVKIVCSPIADKQRYQQLKVNTQKFVANALVGRDALCVCHCNIRLSTELISLVSQNWNKPAAAASSNINGSSSSSSSSSSSTQHIGAASLIAILNSAINAPFPLPRRLFSTKAR
jgi:hypothetical protein